MGHRVIKPSKVTHIFYLFILFYLKSCFLPFCLLPLVKLFLVLLCQFFFSSSTLQSYHFLTGYHFEKLKKINFRIITNNEKKMHKIPLYQQNQPRTWLKLSGKDQRATMETCHFRPHLCTEQ